MTYHPFFPTQVSHRPIKRLFDLLFSLLVMLLGSPIFLILALLVKISSPGPIFYSQLRVGRGGKPIRCWKFRTMYRDADARLNEILREDPNLADEWKKSRKLKNDPRVTPIGSFLRKTSLDELPQFWNVIKGELSVVGPRPVVIDEIECFFGEKARKILTVRPGVTGLWQVMGRSNTSYNERIILDEQYIDEHSFLLDLKIVAKTIPVVLFSKDAY